VLAASTPPVFKSGQRFRSEPIRLTAGRKVPVRIEARRTAKQALYLAWEAEALTAELVPGGLLYPEASGSVEQLSQLLGDHKQGEDSSVEPTERLRQ
jgi:hypothetical protein